MANLPVFLAKIIAIFCLKISYSQTYLNNFSLLLVWAIVVLINFFLFYVHFFSKQPKYFSIARGWRIFLFLSISSFLKSFFLKITEKFPVARFVFPLTGKNHGIWKASRKPGKIRVLVIFCFKNWEFYDTYLYLLNISLYFDWIAYG